MKKHCSLPSLRFSSSLRRIAFLTTLTLSPSLAFCQVPNGTYKIVNRQSGQCLNVTGNVDASPITQYPYNGTTNKQWVLKSIGNGQYTIQGVKSGLYATVASSSTAENAIVQLYRWQDQPNFKVTLTPTGNGYYRITYVHSGKAMAVKGGNLNGSLNYNAQIVQTSAYLTETNTPKASAEWKFLSTTEVANAGTPFTMVVLPDTQEYCSSQGGATNQMFYDQTNWIIAQRDYKKIKYVAHLGDIVDHQFSTIQWDVACNALYRLDNVIPYGVVPGNHDWWDVNDGTIQTGENWSNQNYNKRFGVAHWQGKSYYGGSFGNSNNNHFDLITANGIDFVIVYMEWHVATRPNYDAINWVNSVLKAYPDRRAIVVSHELIDTAGNFKTIGQILYDTIKGNKNLFLMWCGHYNGESSLVKQNGTNVLYTCMSDYQDDPYGGHGKLKVLTFEPAENLLKIETYSPHTGLWYTNPNAQMTIPFEMGIIDGAVYELEPLCAPGRRLEVNAYGNTDGSNVQIWQDRNQTSQRWKVEKQADGSYELIPQNALGMRMDVDGAKTASGTNVQIWTDANVNQQRWILESQTDGNYELIPKHATNLRLDVNGSANADGANVQVYTDNNNTAQRWRLIKQ